MRTWGDDATDDAGDKDDSEAPTASSNSFFRGILGGGKKNKSQEKPRRSLYWPLELLPADIPDTMIWTYGYSADVIAWAYRGNNQSSVLGHSRDLVQRLRRDVPTEV